MTGKQFNESASDEAVTWFTRLQSGDATQDDQRQFEAWRARSLLHAREFDRISALWNDLDDLKDWAGRRLTEESSVNHASAYPLNRMRKRGMSQWGASLAVVLLVLLSGGLWLPDTLVRLAGDYHTETGEQRKLVLADGSTVYLDTDSVISVDFSPQTRRLVLHQGRALFVVAADKLRPFEVSASNGTTRALGTAFEVYQKPDQVAVSVLESKVQVSRDGAAARLVSGQRVYYSPGAGLSEVEPVELGQIAAWRRGKLMFQDRPLGEVIDEVNRYRKGAIFILDRQLRSTLVSGIFDISNPDAVLQALEGALSIRVRRLTRYLILLDRPEALASVS